METRWTEHRAIIVYGPPGSGKGTQASALAQLPKLVHVDMGEVLRETDERSEVGRRARAYTSRGDLVPDYLVWMTWRDYVERLSEEGRYLRGDDVLLLDGMPRTVHQLEMLSQEVRILSFIVIQVEDVEELVSRLRNRASKQGRRDDADEGVIRERLRIYEEQKDRLLEVVDMRTLLRVEGNQRPVGVLRDMAAALAYVLAPGGGRAS
jgi:adenylate kinase